MLPAVPLVEGVDSLIWNILDLQQEGWNYLDPQKDTGVDS